MSLNRFSALHLAMLVCRVLALPFLVAASMPDAATVGMPGILFEI